MNPTQFINKICALSFENTFNPYTDRCAIHDYSNAPHIRKAVLRKMLTAASQAPIDSLWLGRDLGYKGGRRTGLALTDDNHFAQHLARWGINATRPTKGQAVPERTAQVIWSVLASIPRPVFLWNVFPLHPHRANEPFSNRAHNTYERQAGEELLAGLIKMLRPKQIIAIGKHAQHSAQNLNSGLDIIQLRHPSYGGQSEFLARANVIFGLKRASHNTAPL